MERFEFQYLDQKKKENMEIQKLREKKKGGNLDKKSFDKNGPYIPGAGTRQLLMNPFKDPGTTSKEKSEVVVSPNGLSIG